MVNYSVTSDVAYSHLYKLPSFSWWLRKLKSNSNTLQPEQLPVTVIWVQDLKGRKQLGEMKLGHRPGHPPALLGIPTPATTGDVNHLISSEHSKVGGREH